MSDEIEGMAGQEAGHPSRRAGDGSPRRGTARPKGGVARAGGAVQGGGFTPEQRAMLAAALDPAYVKTRKGPKGRTLSYVEGWRIVAEANRIFGHDGWDRETVEVRLLREGEGLDAPGSGPGQAGNKVWTTAYMAKVRITVWAGGSEVVREGLGFGDGTAPLSRPAEAHEGAIKEAETDATKRALVTFGGALGLELYDKQRQEPLLHPEGQRSAGRCGDGGRPPANANARERQSDSAKLDAIESACSPSVQGRPDLDNRDNGFSTPPAAGARVYYLTWSGRNVRGTDPIEVGTAAARALAAAAGEGRLDECWRRAVLPLVRRLAADGHTKAANGLRRRYEELMAA